VVPPSSNQADSTSNLIPTDPAVNEYQGGRPDLQQQQQQYQVNDTNNFHHPMYTTNAGDLYRPTMGEASLIAGFEDEFANIEHLLLDSTGWTGLMDESWNES
jgi:hypothetical protein